MKRILLVSLFLLLPAVSLHAIRIKGVDDVIRLHRSGIDVELLVAIVQKADPPFAVGEADVQRMKNAGVPQEVIDAVLAQAGDDEDAGSEPSPNAEAVQAAEEEVTWNGDYCLEGVYFLWPDPWMLPGWLSDPWWFMPRYDSEVGNTPRGANGAAPAAATSGVRGTRAAEPRRSSIAQAVKEVISQRTKAAEY